MFKNWYEKRYGKNADAKNLYSWAAENNYTIIRFNPISEQKCQAMAAKANYPAFEVEVVSGNLKKGFHVALVYDIVGVTPYDCEIEMYALEFKEAFRLKDGEIEAYKSEF